MIAAGARRFQRRLLKDVLARHAVAVGGVGVIIAIVLIFFYLLYVVVPLFSAAEAEAVADYAVPGEAGATLHLALEEQTEIGARFLGDGRVVFFATGDGRSLETATVAVPDGLNISAFGAGTPARGIVAYGLSDGRALVARHVYRVTFPNDVRQITPAIEYPMGVEPLTVDPQGAGLVKVAVRGGEDQATIVAATADGRMVMTRLSKESSFLDDSEVWESNTVTLPAVAREVHFLLLDPEQRSLYVASDDGELSYFDVSDADEPRLVQRLRVVDKDRQLTTLRFLAGGISLLVGDSAGTITQWFPVRDARNNNVLTRVRDFREQRAPINAIAAEFDRKGFLAADARGWVGVYHTTAHRTLLVAPVSQATLTHLAVAPRANALLAQAADGRVHFWRLHNEHPEVSWSSLWGKVWYESYEEPDYVWQSSSASDDFEPKFSLVPISFGTIKAAFYAMLIAAPLAILGAMFTAHFMAPRLRRIVKPSVEVMEALPTVILGFLAGLWLAPFVENYLPGVFSMLLVLPVGIVVAGYAWMNLPGRVRHRVADGWEPALLIPVVLGLGWLSVFMSPLLEEWFFSGDMRQWLSHEMGVGFDQRNALVVGIAMGFAVVPTIFSIAEDAIFGVPKHLTQGSLALGATPWQTLWRVVLLTASPGIFSALMIGFGRAVGETMIVLMATGNTPVMDFSIFQGLRTLSANIAVEMPESEVNSTHYRVLFLAALVLFMFTFLFNTLAEVVRQRLRRKYSSL